MEEASSSPSPQPASENAARATFFRKQCIYIVVSTCKNDSEGLFCVGRTRRVAADGYPVRARAQAVAGKPHESFGKFPLRFLLPCSAAKESNPGRIDRPISSVAAPPYNPVQPQQCSAYPVDARIRHSRSRGSSVTVLMMQATNRGAVSSSSISTADAGVASSSCEVTEGGPAVVELPLHLTEKILCSISPLESARHATVCKAWAATVSARLARPVPHLFLCTPPDIKSDRRGLVVSVPLAGAARQPPSTVIPARVRSSETNGLRCIGAAPISGRVAFAAGWWSRDVVLANPVTGAHQRVDVGLPGLDPRHSRVLAAGGADDSFFAVEGYKLTLWQRRQAQHHGKAWSRCAVTATLNPTNNIVSAVECNNGVFYLLHEDGCLSTVDATVPPPLRMEKLPVESLAYQFGSGRLLESDGEVLFVRQLLSYKEVSIESSCMSSLSVAGFEVYRLDVKEQRWTKVNKLPAHRALFVSPGSSFAVRASEVEGCRSNCIYFAGENQYYSSPASREDGECSWGLYSMEDRRVLFEHVIVTEPGRGAEVLWFLPRASLGRLCKSFHNKFV